MLTVQNDKNEGNYGVVSVTITFIIITKLVTEDKDVIGVFLLNLYLYETVKHYSAVAVGFKGVINEGRENFVIRNVVKQVTFRVEPTDVIFLATKDSNFHLQAIFQQDY